MFPSHVHSSFANHSRRRSRRAARGFTLLEVLVSIAIITLVASVLIGGSSRLMSDQPQTPHEIFWKAVQEARKTALKSEHEVRLKYDKEKKQFVLIDGLAPATIAADGFTREEKALKQFPLPPALSADLTIEFLPPATKNGGNTVLIGGMLVETQTVPFVTFFSDGTCTAFRVQFMRPTGTGSLSIDPWTCAPMLTPNDPNAPPTS